MDSIQLIVLLLALFGVKHFICDFVLQFPYMLQGKGSYGARGGIDHALVHAAGTFVILLILINHSLAGFIAACILAVFDGVIHYHIDWAKQQLNKGLTVADRMFWVWFGADQGLHYLTYIAIIGIIVLF